MKRRVYQPPAVRAWAMAAAVLLTGCAATSPAPAPPSKTGEAPLEGYRFESMRLLSERLVERLEAARQAAQNPRAGGFERREVAPRLEAVLVDARKFADRMSNYQDPPRFVSEDVQRLDAAVRGVERGVHDVWPGSRSHDRWREGLDVLDRMKRVLAGEIVDLPPGPGSVTPRPPEPTPRLPAPTPVALDVARARELAHELAVRATLAYENGARYVPRSTDAERRLVSDLDYFRLRARELESRLSSPGAAPFEARSMVIGLRDDARRIDRDLAAFPNLRSQWGEVLRGLESLEEATR